MERENCFPNKHLFSEQKRNMFGNGNRRSPSGLVNPDGLRNAGRLRGKYIHEISLPGAETDTALISNLSRVLSPLGFHKNGGLTLPARGYWNSITISISLSETRHQLLDMNRSSHVKTSITFSFKKDPVRRIKHISLTTCSM